MADGHKTKLVDILIKEIGLSPEEAAQRADLILRETTPLSERRTLYEEPAVTRREGPALAESEARLEAALAGIFGREGGATPEPVELSEAEQRIRAALESMGYGPREGGAPSNPQAGEEQRPTNAANGADSPAARLDQALRELRAR